jgi:hypothetical protein
MKQAGALIEQCVRAPHRLELLRHGGVRLLPVEAEEPMLDASIDARQASRSTECRLPGLVVARVNRLLDEAHPRSARQVFDVSPYPVKSLRNALDHS